MRAWNSLVLAFCGTVAMAAPSYQIIGLGNLGGPATAFGINNNGTVVGTSADAFGNMQGFVWNGGSLLALPGIPNSMQQYAVAINNSGTVVGSGAGANGQVPLRWQNGTVSLIGSGEGNAMAINDDGAIAGTLNGQAFRTVNGQVESLGSLNGGTWASAYGINASGTVAGYGNTATGAMRGFVWRNGQTEQIGTFGGSSSYAMGINNAGQVVGHATNAQGYSQAFLYRDGWLTGLGTLGGSASYGYGVNRFGVAVGYSWLSGDTGLAAFVYSDGKMFNLNDLVASNVGWQITEAYGINDLGQIVGTGTFNGQQMAVLLNPLAPAPPVSGLGNAAVVATPEPGTVGLVALGLGFLAFGGWRKRTRADIYE